MSRASLADMASIDRQAAASGDIRDLEGEVRAAIASEVHDGPGDVARITEWMYRLWASRGHVDERDLRVFFRALDLPPDERDLLIRRSLINRRMDPRTRDEAEALLEVWQFEQRIEADALRRQDLDILRLASRDVTFKYLAWVAAERTKLVLLTAIAWKRHARCSVTARRVSTITRAPARIRGPGNVRVRSLTAPNAPGFAARPLTHRVSGVPRLALSIA